MLFLLYKKMKRVRHVEIDVIGKECRAANISPELVAEIRAQKESAIPLKKEKRTELSLLCHMYFDLQPAESLVEFLDKYLSESRDTVTVITFIEGGSFNSDRHEFNTMPSKALEYLRLVEPVAEDVTNGRGNLHWGDVEFNDEVNDVEPAHVSIPAAEWFTHEKSVGDFWASVVEEHDGGKSYAYFLEHYADKDRNEQVLKMYKSGK